MRRRTRRRLRRWPSKPYKLTAEWPRAIDAIARGHIFSRRYYFFINSNTAVVIALIAVRIVGSGTGANRAEWSEGSGTPVCLLWAILAGSTAPTQKMTAGI